MINVNRKKMLQPSHPSQGGNLEKKKYFIYSNHQNVFNDTIYNNSI